LSADRPRVTLYELQTIYGLEDLYDLLEIVSVDVENERIVAEWREKQRDR
jgi:hypothetical protein